MNEKELIEIQIANLQGQIKEKQKKLEELSKTPCEIAYKEWWGEYPTNYTWNDDVSRWKAFQMGYNAAYREPQDNEWKNVALEFGKKLPAILPYSYAELSPNSWYKWVVFTYDKYMEERDKECGYTPNQKAQERGERVHNEMEEVVRESVKWCEENQDKDPLEWLTPKTPEETAESLREAFVKAQQTEKWKEIQKKIDEEDNDKNFKNSLDLIKEWGEKNKSKTLYQICMEWWNEVFVNQMDDDICVDVLVSKIDKEFIPPSSEKNGYEWEKCLKIMRDKLR